MNSHTTAAKAFADGITCITKRMSGSGNAVASMLYLARCRRLDELSKCQALDVLVTDEEGIISRLRGRDATAWVARELAATCPVGVDGAEVAMFMISAPSDTRHSEAIEARLVRAGHDLARCFLPGRQYAMAVHRDKKHMHLHLAGANYDREWRALEFPEGAFTRLWTAGYTDQFECPKGKGKSKRASRKAPTTGERAIAIAKKRSLAAKIVDGQALCDLVATGVVEVVRRDIEGAPRTYRFDGQCIGVKALGNLVRSERKWRVRRMAKTTLKAAATVVQKKSRSLVRATPFSLLDQTLNHL